MNAVGWTAITAGTIAAGYMNAKIHDTATENDPGAATGGTVVQGVAALVGLSVLIGSKNPSVQGAALLLTGIGLGGAFASAQNT